MQMTTIVKLLHKPIVHISRKPKRKPANKTYTKSMFTELEPNRTSYTTCKHLCKTYTNRQYMKLRPTPVSLLKSMQTLHMPLQSVYKPPKDFGCLMISLQTSTKPIGANGEYLTSCKQYDIR